MLNRDADDCATGPAVVDQLRAVFRQPEIIIGSWRAAREHSGGISEADVREALWDELFPAEQARIVTLLVERVDIGVGGLAVRLRVGIVDEIGVRMRTAA